MVGVASVSVLKKEKLDRLSDHEPFLQFPGFKEGDKLESFRTISIGAMAWAVSVMGEGISQSVF